MAELARSRKVLMALCGVAALLVLVLVGSLLTVQDEIIYQGIEAIQWIVGLLIGGHAFSDVGHQVATAVRERPPAQSFVQPVLPPPPQPPPPPSGTDQTERVTPVETPSARLPRPAKPFMGGNR